MKTIYSSAHQANQQWRRLVWSLALIASLMLPAASAIAATDIVLPKYTQPSTGGNITAGLIVGAPNPDEYLFNGATGYALTPGGGDTFLFGNTGVISFTDHTKIVSGIWTNRSDNYDLSIGREDYLTMFVISTYSGPDGKVAGFMYDGSSPFAGNISDNEYIAVRADSSGTTVYGFAFFDNGTIANRADIAGNIDARILLLGAGDAYGFYAGTIKSDVRLGQIFLGTQGETIGGEATGIDITGISPGGTLSVWDMEIYARGDATGVKVTGDVDGTLNVDGDIFVRSTLGDAVGIYVDGTANINVKGDINVEGGPGSTAIKTGNQSNLTLYSDIVSSGNGIEAGANSSITIKDGASFDASGTHISTGDNSEVIFDSSKFNNNGQAIRIDGGSGGVSELYFSSGSNTILSTGSSITGIGSIFISSGATVAFELGGGTKTGNVVITGAADIDADSSVIFLGGKLGEEHSILESMADDVAAQQAVINGNAFSPGFLEWVITDVSGLPGVVVTTTGTLAEANVKKSDLYLASGILTSPRHNVADAVKQSDSRYIPKRWSYASHDSNSVIRGQSRDTAHGFQKLSGNSVWVNYIGRSNELASSHYTGRSFDITSNGVQVGATLYSNRCTRFGIATGYEKEKAELMNDSLEADDYYVGLYAARKLGHGFDLNGYVGYGHQSFDMTRIDRWWSNRHTAKFKGNNLDATLEIGRWYHANRSFALRPVLAFDVFNNDIDGATETGNVYSALRYDGLSLTQVFARIGSDFQWNRNRWNINGGFYYSYDMANNDRLSTQVWNGGVSSTLTGSDLGSSTLSFNIGSQYYLDRARTFALFGNYYADCYVDRDDSPIQHTGMVGLQRRF